MEQYCVTQANMIAISLFCTAHIVMKDSLQFELFDGDGLHTFQVAIFQRSVKYLFSWRVRSLPKSYHFGDNRTLKNIWKWMDWSLGQTNNPIFFGFWSNRIFVQCTNFLVLCKATPVRTSIEKFPLAIGRNRRSNFISLGQHTKKGAIFTWNISIHLLWSWSKSCASDDLLRWEGLYIQWRSNMTPSLETLSGIGVSYHQDNGTWW